MKFLNWIVQFAEDFGRARAAAELSRLGYYRAARNLYNGNEKN